MSSAARRLGRSPEEYLAREERSEIRHEYFAGQIIAMAGGTIAHNRIAGNFYAFLLSEFQKGGDRCQAFMNDVRLHSRQSGSFTYPDVFAVCGPLQYLPGRTDTLMNAILIAEVLSRSTEGNDRGVKFQSAQRIPSLREYVLFRQDVIHVEVFRPLGTTWGSFATYNDPEAVIVLESVGCQFRLGDMYRGVAFETAEPMPRLMSDGPESREPQE